MYAINVTLSPKGVEGWERNGTQIPTFYLDENVQGIVDEEHARKIARKIIRDPDAWIIIVKL